MSSRNRRAARRAGQPDTNGKLRQDASPRLLRWFLLVLCLILTGAALTFLYNANPAQLHLPPAGAALEKNPAPTGINPPSPTIVSGETNQAETEAGEDRVVALVEEGNQFLAQANYAEAAQRFTQAVAIEPGDEVLHYNLAIALAKLGKREEARKHYLEALQIYPDYGDAHNNLGNLLMMENKPAEGVDHFREAVRSMPDNASFHNNLGTALGLQGKTAEAMAEFAEAVKLKPDYVDARVNLANACLGLGRVEEAAAQLEEALRLKPDSQPALQTLRRVQQKQGAVAAPK